jgi:hypothetical protein
MPASAQAIGQVVPMLASLLERAPYLPVTLVEDLAQEALGSLGSDGDLLAWGQIAGTELERWRHVWTDWPMAPQPLEMTGQAGPPLPPAAVAPAFEALAALGMLTQALGTTPAAAAGWAVLRAIHRGDSGAILRIAAVLGPWLAKWTP